MKVKQKNLTIGLLASVIFVALYLSVKVGMFDTVTSSLENITTDHSAIKNALVEEFDNAYPQNSTENGNIKEFTIVASESSTTIVDDIETKVWTYNGTIPGPELRVDLGDTVRVTFENELPDETTIHWHGVRVKNAMDGVPGITQDPIQPNETFVYEFTPKDAGTFWFHPHVRGSEQVERGLYGSLIVEDADNFPYSQDVVWILDDWLLQEDGQISPHFNTPHDLMHDGRWGNTITVNGNTDEILSVNPGERIRLRMINTSNGRVYAPDFGRLNAKIIAVDGMYVESAMSASGFEIAPGNRIDVDIIVDSTLKNTNIEIRDEFTRNSFTLGTIEVTDTLVETPTFQHPSNKNIPTWTNASALEADHIFELNAQRTMGRGMGIEWTINKQAYPESEAISLNAGNFYKLTYKNDSFRLHPMHLHGQFFKVLSRNGQPLNEQYFRDTVLVHPQEIVEIGLIPFDTGAWAHHCHILEHAEAGMMNTIQVL